MEILIGENNQTLRQKSLPVRRINADVRSLIEQMRKVMKQNNGVGLAAIQIGEPTRIIVCEIDDKFYAFINPEIIKSFPETSAMEEGCLSLPNMYGEVERPKKISLKAIDFDGKKIKIKAFGLLARVVQHEIDHLDGILFIDKAKDITKQIRKTTAL
ncbi:MAG TPA: peptide deformylase [Candidatus Paceibacterota bacterium]|nr:peptide deformylase [Candidatus Paceibacterota bacterium]